ncbi:hypothetical protein BHF68_05585 [Desulfuribacillus alkaliarsenatis]|uniref:Uncharacterized protein n=1 Tax=Desulfuribacillus alkaliarsenatis TaxID=766136 RepID=A0A1E5G3B0_9FIRM|nr:hypothetical protein BHF68_05585 [Desulfuribacillus alkaliarsenatis]
MRSWMNEIFESTKQYTMLDFSFLKICLISLGILLGVYFSELFLSYIFIVWTIAIVSYVFIMYKTFGKYLRSNSSR